MNAPHTPQASVAPASGPLPAARKEDRRLVTGRGRYTADWNLPGQAHAFVLRSDRAHARLLGIDRAAALAHPGCLLVLTAQELAPAGFGELPAGAPLQGADGQPQIKCPMPVLATDRVRFVGQPVAMVIAESARAAQDAAEQILVDYEDLPAVASMAAASAPGAPIVHDTAPGNLSLVHVSGDEAAVEAAFVRAKYVSTLRMHSQRITGAPLELRAALAEWDAASDSYTVYTPTQGMLGMRSSLSQVTGIPQDRIRVIADDVGGSFGLRGGTASEQVLLMLAARTLKRPVKWVASRSELFTGEWHGRGLTLQGRIALDEDQRILAIRWDDQADLGAYSCYWQSFIGTRNISVTMGGVYRVPALFARQELIYTNTVPISAYRGAGRPDIAYAIERLMDQVAADHGLDRIALRRRNFIPNDAFPYTTANGTVYDCGDFEGTLDKALALARTHEFEARREASERAGKLRGWGLGCYLEASGAGAAPKDVVRARFVDGVIQLFGVTGPSGQGHETSFTQIVADGLGLPTEVLRYKASDPGQELMGNGTGGSRSLYGAGSAFKVLVDRLRERACETAARLLQQPAGSVHYEAGGVRGSFGHMSLMDLAERLRPADAQTAHPLDCDGESVSGTTFPNGCHVAEVEIDPQTGVTTVTDYSAIDDLGYVVSPQLVQGQVHGGVLQGAGQVFGEHLVYDADTAQLLTGSFMDYPMPRAGWIRQIRNDYNNVPTALNALGAKGVGESGCSGSLPAIVNAMSDALRRRGVPPMDMPFTPARVWQALRDQRTS
jgi:carbon-monoxide dehydrogenase large subunit